MACQATVPAGSLITDDVRAARPLARLAAPALTLRADGRRLLMDILDEGITAGVFHMPDAFLAVTAISGMGMRVANWYDSAMPYEPEKVADTYAEFALRMTRADA
ncbi:hypothetical protein OUY22_29000 [Nonomuraea sp. MCN248]|uniref:HTH-type transcriptional repressor KstR2 C-terminal domain-containing protein n=1 Tax=Nonomuraea corallina TaxID=2989783 RepID=A0ABT4SJQ9_9ACTN|nr:hypothetical protein [Nonomuraea corallina]MDA0637463.1 hypothetical protein [Nonomuraea corallina]